MEKLKKAHPSLVIAVIFFAIIGFHRWDPFGWNKSIEIKPSKVNVTLKD